MAFWWMYHTEKMDNAFLMADFAVFLRASFFA
jgi:hypothetical protein